MRPCPEYSRFGDKEFEKQVWKGVLLLALTIVPMYYFTEGVAIPYKVKMSFEGYLPILGVGEGKADVNGTFEVTGKPNFSAEVKLTAFDVNFNGGKIPIDLDDAQKYVPGGAFTYTGSGMVSGWNPPLPSAPIKVPGLDLKHLPEVLFLPIAFPVGGCEIGKSFMFSVPLSGGVADYTVTPAAGSVFNFKIHQTYSDFEDDANQVVAEKDAALKVVTEVVGAGTGTFGSKSGRFLEFHIDDVSTSMATDVQTKKVTTRNLNRHMDVKS